jgi:uncharacterized repeat protein (TIGR03833 family)
MTGSNRSHTSARGRRADNRRNSGRPRGFQGGYGSRPRDGAASNATVPNSAEVNPGAAVSIVLKADQPTGREVQGIVDEVLTRADHPRGIKVRLKDGRVGRVQRLATDDEASQVSTAETWIQHDLNNQNERRRGRGGLGGRNNRDIRMDDDYDYESSMNARNQLSLADYIRTPRQQEHENSEDFASTTIPDPSRQLQENFSSATVICPICADFEGDEGAVSFHVESHFSEH